MRFAVDTGGTFTDLLVEDTDGTLRTYKAEISAADPVAGVLGAFDLAAKRSLTFEIPERVTDDGGELDLAATEALHKNGP